MKTLIGRIATASMCMVLGQGLCRAEGPPGETPKPVPEKSSTVLASSTFDRGNEGWQVTNNGEGINPVWVTSGGHTGGYISIQDQRTYDSLCWVAPEKFLGDKSAAFGGTLTFYVGGNRTPNIKKGTLVVLTGAGMMITVPIPYLAGSSWSLYSVTLSEAGGWVHKDAGSAATSAEIQEVLASIQQLQIMGDYYGAPNEFEYLDDVTLAGPENGGGGDDGEPNAPQDPNGRGPDSVPCAPGAAEIDHLAPRLRRASVPCAPGAAPVILLGFLGLAIIRPTNAGRR